MTAFQAWDTKGRGKISKDELAKTFKNLGQDFTEEEFEQLFLAADTNGDGEIDYQEFVAWMFGL